MHVFINPGHSPKGDPDCGAVNSEIGLRESDVATEIGCMVEGYLKIAGCDVTTLQSDNLAGEGEGENVTALANEILTDVFVSIHCNASKTRKARGAETLCFEADSRAGTLASCIQNQLVNAVQEINPYFPDRGVKERPELLVLNQTIMPAVLVETAFIDNTEDANLLIMHSKEIAAAIARGITDYELMYV